MPDIHATDVKVQAVPFFVTLIHLVLLSCKINDLHSFIKQVHYMSTFSTEAYRTKQYRSINIIIIKAKVCGSITRAIQWK